MRNRRNSGFSILGAGALAAGALLIGSPGRAAFAAQPATADEAQAMAKACGDRAEQYRQSAFAGAAYKTGLIQREEACAARYDGVAAALASPTAAPPQSPQAEHYNALAAHYRFVGGAAYKTGLVQEAEAQARRHETAAAAPAPAPAEPNPVCLTSKPAVLPECS